MKKIIFGIAFIIFFSFLVVSAINMRTFGEPTYSEMDDYFIENAQSETGANNVVTSIVFDYRGFDTLGEATVLFTAVMGVVALFQGGQEMKEMSRIVKTVTNFIYGFIIIFGFYIIAHGHLTPGGGFQGGAVVGSAFALLLVSYGSLNAKKFLKKDILSLFEGFGLILFIVLGFSGLGITFFYNFLANGGSWFGDAVVIGVNPGNMNTGGVIPLMNIAVGLEVLSAFGVIVLTMASGAEFTKKKENS